MSSSSVTTEQLQTIKNKIESMSKYHQIEILRIFNKHNTKLNENKNGVFINLSYVSENIIEETEKYIKYVEEQEETLITAEYQKDEYKNTMFLSSS